MRVTGYLIAMHTHSAHVLAASGGPGVILVVVGVLIVLGLVIAFVAGRRRTARRAGISTPPAHPGPIDDQAQRGTGWQTPNDDPAQGHPHR
ncbi:DUF6479 family protein [Streptomyces sp. HUAS MG91]|uniref:DUF6479 family protein n=1 Tax=Streptomyces tabacisoli TaxID=3156398 RepID=A0AAU8IM36_9ACTN